MKIVFLPLDERPCNYLYPSLLPLPKCVNLSIIPLSLLSKKKVPADVNKIQHWVINESKDADYLVISMDTFLYGGILPSRLHHEDEKTLSERLNAILEIKKNNPKIKIFAFQLIMRCPSYSSGDEEPDYFYHYGADIFRYGVLEDKISSNIATKDEEEEYSALKVKVPVEYINDFKCRREINNKIILKSIKLAKEGLIDSLVIPQDDCAVYGFTAKEKRFVKQYIKQLQLEKDLLIYPGADEVGLTLLAKAINDCNKYQPKIYVTFACDDGKEAIPGFEDRPVNETISFQIISSGAIRVNTLQEADIVLNINNGLYFPDSVNEDKKLYLGERYDIERFIKVIKESKKLNLVTGIGDILFSNRGDISLIKVLEKENLLLQIDGYAGWNTSSNTLGTIISTLIAYFYSKDEVKKNKFLLFRYLEDVSYMDHVRGEMINIIEGSTEGIDRFNLKQFKEKYEGIAANLIKKHVVLTYPSLKEHVLDLSVDFVWNRTFEIKLNLKDNF